MRTARAHPNPNPALPVRSLTLTFNPNPNNPNPNNPNPNPNPTLQLSALEELDAVSVSLSKLKQICAAQQSKMQRLLGDLDDARSAATEANERASKSGEEARARGEQLRMCQETKQRLEATVSALQREARLADNDYRAGDEEARRQVDALRRRISELESHCTRMQESSTAADAKCARLAQDANALRTEAMRAREEAADARARSEETRRGLDDMMTRYEAARSELDRAEAEIRALRTSPRSPLRGRVRNPPGIPRDSPHQVHRDMLRRVQGGDTYGRQDPKMRPREDPNTRSRETKSAWAAPRPANVYREPARQTPQVPDRHAEVIAERLPAADTPPPQPAAQSDLTSMARDSVAMEHRLMELSQERDLLVSIRDKLARKGSRRRADRERARENEKRLAGVQSEIGSLKLRLRRMNVL